MAQTRGDPYSMENSAAEFLIKPADRFAALFLEQPFLLPSTETIGIDAIPIGNDRWLGNQSWSFPLLVSER